MVYGTIFAAFAMLIANVPMDQKGAAPKQLPESPAPDPKTVVDVRRHTAVIIGPRVARYIRTCAPASAELDRVTTTVTIQLKADGSLERILTATQMGVDETNKVVGQLLLQCITGSVRRASPFSGLDPNHYEVWRIHRMVFKPRRNV
jgi:hypothetical protein